MNARVACYATDQARLPPHAAAEIPDFSKPYLHTHNALERTRDAQDQLPRGASFDWLEQVSISPPVKLHCRGDSGSAVRAC